MTTATTAAPSPTDGSVTVSTAAGDESARYRIELEPASSGRTVVRLAGEFEMESRAELAAVLDRALRTGSGADIDVSAVTFLYSGAAHSIIDAVENSLPSGPDVRVVGANRVVGRIFSALGVTHLLGGQP